MSFLLFRGVTETLTLWGECCPKVLINRNDILNQAFFTVSMFQSPSRVASTMRAALTSLLYQCFKVNFSII